MYVLKMLPLSAVISTNINNLSYLFIAPYMFVFVPNANFNLYLTNSVCLIPPCTYRPAKFTIKLFGLDLTNT